MADNSDMVANMARILAIVHSIVGFLLFCFGIVNLLVGYSLIGFLSYGIWMGVWVSIACVYFRVAHAIFNSKPVLMFELRKKVDIVNLTPVNH